MLTGESGAGDGDRATKARDDDRELARGEGVVGPERRDRGRHETRCDDGRHLGRRERRPGRTRGGRGLSREESHGEHGCHEEATHAARIGGKASVQELSKR